MFNLINVYGIITFNINNVNIVIMSNQNRNNNCLYYKTINFAIDYLQKNYDLVHQTLAKELINIDKFLGLTIKRYIINIPHLLMNINPQLSDKLNLENEGKLLNYLNNLHSDKNTLNIKQEIIGYFQKQKFLKKFPTNNKPYIVSYLNYSCSNDSLNNVFRLIKDLKIVVLSFYNNATSFQLANTNNKNNKKRLLIDLTNDSTHIYAYDINNHIVNSQSINIGINTLKKQIAEMINVNDIKVVEKLLHNYSHISTIENKDVIIANVHDESFLNVSPLTLSNLKEISIYLVKPYFEQINHELKISDFNEIYFNCDHSTKYLFECALNSIGETETIKINNLPVVIHDRTIFGLESENINNLVWILDGINNEKELHPNIQYLSSIDPYVSEELNVNNFQQNLLMKFGILTTSFSAKLGMAVDEIWKN